MELMLYACATVQAAIALLNLALASHMGWRPALEQLPPLIREVFYVHSLYISVTVGGLAAFTFAFAGDIASGDTQCIAVAWFIGAFWALRVVLQLGFYSSNHWVGKAKETAIHIALLAAFVSLSATYLYAALR